MAEELGYVARRPCGCLCMAATVHAVQESAETRKEIAEMMAEGLSIERMSYPDIRKAPWRCEKCRPSAPLFEKSEAPAHA